MTFVPKSHVDCHDCAGLGRVAFDGPKPWSAAVIGECPTCRGEGRIYPEEEEAEHDRTNT